MNDTMQADQKNEIWSVSRRRGDAVTANIISGIASSEKTWTESNGCGGALVSLHVVSTKSNNSSPDSCRGEQPTPRLAGFITPPPDRAVLLNTELLCGSLVSSDPRFKRGHEMMGGRFIPLKHLHSDLTFLHQSAEIIPRFSRCTFSLFQQCFRN